MQIITPKDPRWPRVVRAVLDVLTSWAREQEVHSYQDLARAVNRVIPEARFLEFRDEIAQALRDATLTVLEFDTDAPMICCLVTRKQGYGGLPGPGLGYWGLAVDLFRLRPTRDPERMFHYWSDDLTATFTYWNRSRVQRFHRWLRDNEVTTEVPLQRI